MDIAEILKSANMAFEQVKKVSVVTEDANAIMGNLTGFAGQLGELKKALVLSDVKDIHQKTTSKKKPEKTSTEKAMDIYAARVRLRQMEQELYHMFLYGDLNHLGMDGYKEFCKIREDMENRARQQATEEHAWELSKEADEEILKKLKIAGGAVFGSVVAGVELAQQIKDLFS